MNRPFIIDDKARAQFNRLVEYAKNNPLTMDDLLDTYNRQKAPVGNIPEHVIETEFGYRIVFSIEQQVKADVRHLSVSVDTIGKYPNMEVVEQIMLLCGFAYSLTECLVKLEDIGPDHQAINVYEAII